MNTHAGNQSNVILAIEKRLPQLTEEATVYLGESLAYNTRLAYQSDLAIFLAWCQIYDRCPFPAAPVTLIDFISDQATGRYTHYKAGSLSHGKKIRPNTLSRRIAAIAYAHKAKGFTQSAVSDDLVRKVMQGIHRKEGVPVSKKKPITPPILHQLLDQINRDSLTGRRDYALLVLGFACALRRSEIVALRVEDIETVAEGLLIHLRTSKTDPFSKGQSVAVMPGLALCPIRALTKWLEVSKIQSGFIFRRAFRTGKIDQEDRHITPAYVSIFIKRYAKKAGIDPKQLSGHSLRRGFITAAAQNGANLSKIMAVSRHKSVNMVQKYVEDVEKFINHAGAGLL